VRVALDDVSFISGETAWQDIYEFHIDKKKTPPYLKDAKWLSKPLNNVPGLVAASEAEPVPREEEPFSSI
jgi:hypothetical protein